MVKEGIETLSFNELQNQAREIFNNFFSSKFSKYKDELNILNSLIVSRPILFKL